MNANFYCKAISNMQLQELSKVEFEKYYDTLIKEKSRKTASFPIQLCKRCSSWLLGVKRLITKDNALYAKRIMITIDERIESE